MCCQTKAIIVADLLDVFLHEPVVVAPFDSGRAHGGLLGARRDLMRMEVMQVELIDQGFLDFLVQDQEAIGVDVPSAVAQRRRHVAVDVDRLAVPAVAGEVGDVVLAIEILDPAHHRIERPVHHQARNVPFRQPQLLVRSVHMTEVPGHRALLGLDEASRQYRRFAAGQEPKPPSRLAHAGPKRRLGRHARPSWGLVDLQPDGPSARPPAGLAILNPILRRCDQG